MSKIETSECLGCYREWLVDELCYGCNTCPECEHVTTCSKLLHDAEEETQDRHSE